MKKNYTAPALEILTGPGEKILAVSSGEGTPENNDGWGPIFRP